MLTNKHDTIGGRNQLTTAAAMAVSKATTEQQLFDQVCCYYADGCYADSFLLRPGCFACIFEG